MTRDHHVRTVVDLGTHQRFVECAGTGVPTILLEAGGGQSCQTWEPIWPALTSLTRACRYDRAGVGQSTPGPRPTSCQQLAQDLHTVLQTAGIPGPYLLVSHSFGSFIARVYAHEHPDQIVGTLLLDPSHEAIFPRWVEFYTQILDQLPAPTDTELPVLTDLRGYLTRISQGDPWESIPEGYTFYPSAAAVRTTHFGDDPVVVLTSDRPPELPPDMPQTVLARLAPILEAMRDTLHALHRDLAHTARFGDYQVVGKSGHFIHHDQPDVVIAAVRHLVEMVRYQQPRG